MIGIDLALIPNQVVSPNLKCMHHGCKLQIMGGIILLMGFELAEAYATTFPSCMRTHPNPCREASQYTTKSHWISGKVSTGAVVNLLFNSWKLFSHDSV
jgi:hypothetical protein